MRPILPLSLCALSLLAGCASPGVSPGGPAPARALPASPTQLIGTNATGLTRLFGNPRLDIRDPTARKLQFANGRCVLDAYLYPPAAGREPLVTYVEARDPQGTAVDSSACARTLAR